MNYRLIQAALIGALSLGASHSFAQISAPAETPLPSPVFKIADMDKTADPGKDFNQYVNGGWIKANPIPDEYSRWGSFTILGKRNQQIVRALLEKAAAETSGATPGSDAQKIGDFYASGMNEDAINRTGAKPIKPELDKIDAVKDRAGLLAEIAHLHSIGFSALFGFGQMQDLMDSTQVIGAARQGGLGLPDRDYYLKQDDKTKAIRAAYIKHITELCQLLGDSPAKAQAAAATVMNLETELAHASMTRVDMRNPNNIYHPMTRAQLAALTPHLDWPKYFTDSGVSGLGHINVAQPEFFKEVEKQLSAFPIADWKTYLRVHVIDGAAPYLSQPFIETDFRMQQALTGAKKLQPRWQRVYASEDRSIGFAVGKIFVEQNFPAKSKEQVTEILHNIKAALKDDIEHLEWMSPATREQALAKLALISEKIGYPEVWRDYSKLTIDRGPWIENVMRSAKFEHDRQLAKIGKPVDRTEWSMTPQTVNAYYNPPMNEIVFPAGILMPPFFDPNAPAAINYGAIGVVIGHEISHGFDDEGAKYDGHGNLKNWWTPEDLAKFQKATSSISEQYSKYTVAGDASVQGKLVTGEATADLGGTKLAWRAYKARNMSTGWNDITMYPGFTPDQLFFLGFGHVWATNIRDEEARRLATTDSHPPAEFRVNGTLANVPEFQKAFSIPAGSVMVNAEPAVIW